MNDSWAVIVERNGDTVVTLSSNGMGGRDLIVGDEEIIRRAAEHLLAFIGQSDHAERQTGGE